MKINETQCIDILQKMMRIGYFSNGSFGFRELSAFNKRDTSEAFNNDNFLFFSAMEQKIFTFSHFAQKIKSEVELAGGRICCEDLSHRLQVDVTNIEPAVKLLVEQSTSQNEESNPPFMIVGNEILSSSYLDELVAELNVRLRTASSKNEGQRISYPLAWYHGRLFVTDVAFNIFGLTVESTIEILNQRLHLLEGMLLNEKTEIVSDTYILAIKSQVYGALSAASQPTAISTLRRIYQWPDQLPSLSHSPLNSEPLFPLSLSSSILEKKATMSINSYVSHLCERKIIPGQFSEFSGIYTPNVYIECQRKAIKDLFTVNGFITPSQMEKLGLSSSGKSKLIEEIEQHKYDAEPMELFELPVSKIIFQKSVLLSGGIEEILSSNQIFVDLNLYIPEGLVCNCDDERDFMYMIEICYQSIFTDPNKKVPRGDKVILSHGTVLYFTADFIKEIKTNVIPRALNDFAKKYAMAEVKPINRKKICKKGNRAVKIKGGDIGSDGENPLIPLTTLCLALTKAYPELNEIRSDDLVNLKIDDDEQQICWSNFDKYGPLFELAYFCVLPMTDFIKKCNLVVQVEYEKVQSSKHCLITNSNKYTVEPLEAPVIVSLFEDLKCFGFSCYFLQLLEKCAATLLGQENYGVEKNWIEQEFLLPCASQFAWRVTEYCIFKYNIDRDLVSFSYSESVTKEEDTRGDNEGLPMFYQGINVGLTCMHWIRIKSGMPGNNDPLDVLLKVMPKQVGMYVSRMWSLCQIDIAARADEGINSCASSLFREFMDLVKESCIVMCGIPFRIIDKKSEKNFMNARNNSLKEKLQQNTNAKKILEICILLLFQQVNKIIILHNMIPISTLVTVLVKDGKKISKDAGKVLVEFADIVYGADSFGCDEALSERLANHVKEIGLCKNVAKYSLS